MKCEVGEISIIFGKKPILLAGYKIRIDRLMNLGFFICFMGNNHIDNIPYIDNIFIISDKRPILLTGYIWLLFIRYIKELGSINLLTLVLNHVPHIGNLIILLIKLGLPF